MDEGTMGMMILGAIVAICSVLAHLLLKYFWLAVVTAAFSSVVLFQVAAYIYVGYLDPFFIFAVINTLGISTFAAIVIGFIFRLKRSKETGNGNNST